MDSVDFNLARVLGYYLSCKERVETSPFRNQLNSQVRWALDTGLRDAVGVIYQPHWRWLLMGGKEFL